MDFKANVPIYLQVIKDIERKIIAGELPLGSKLPSSREMAITYKINPNTAARVYNEMELMGLSFTKRGIGTFVTEEEGAIKTMKNDLIKEVLDEFVTQTKGLGFAPEEVIKLLEEYYKNEN